MKPLPVALASILATSSIFVAGNKINNIKQENTELKEQIKYNKISNQSHIEDVKEINKNNCKLIIYESSQGAYNKSMEEDSFIPVKSTLSTKYSYKVEIDLSKAEVMEINNVTYVEIDYSTIKLSSVTIEKPQIKNQTNLITQFKGKAISEINNQILTQSYEEIYEHITKDYNSKQDTFKINLQNKIKSLYEGMDVTVNYK